MSLPSADLSRSSELSVGFMSLLSPADLAGPPDSSHEGKKKNGVSSNKLSPINPFRSKSKSCGHGSEASMGDCYVPQMVYSGQIYKKGRTRWSEYYAECSMVGVLTLKNTESSKKDQKRIPLKSCTVKKISAKEFHLLRPGKNPIQFRSDMEEDVAIWVPTLSVSRNFVWECKEINDFWTAI